MTISNTPARLLLAICGVCSALTLVTGAAQARTLSEVTALGAISVCLNPDALPYSSDKPETPGFQLELAREIASGLGLSLNVDWILPRRRAKVVNCDMLVGSVNDPKMSDGRRLLSHPYQTSGVALGMSRGAAPIVDYSELQPGQKVGVRVNSVASVVLGRAGKTISPRAFQAELIEELETGQMYAIAVSSASMSYYILQHPESGLTLAYAFDNEPDLGWEMSVGLRKSDQALVDAVNVIVDRLLADGTISRIYQRYGVEHRMP
jgi:polar amino acid transport system substrate-binding protein